MKKQNKVKKVMKEFKAGTLKSYRGPTVTKRAQAVAIALSEQKRANKGKKKKY